MPRESSQARQIRAAAIVDILRRTYPEARCALNFTTAHELLVATILSAQCTDERVNKTTPALFSRFRSIDAFANAELSELEELVKSTGFFRNKAKAIKQSAIELVNRFDGEVPGTLAELHGLTGVGRKTASVVLGVWFGKAEGIVVDTHVSRISQLLRLSLKDDPITIERDLMKTIRPDDWIHFSHLLIHHGRAVCIARRPQCAICTIAPLCPSARVQSKSSHRKND